MDIGESIAAALTSPFAHFVIGGGLFYGVQKFFKEVEEKLNDDARLEIAVWLLGLHLGSHVQNWPSTFAATFDRIFGPRHLSWHCFLRSALASLALTCLSLGLHFIHNPSALLDRQWQVSIVSAILFVNILPDYVSLLESRLVLRVMTQFNSSLAWLVGMLVDAVVTVSIGLFCARYLLLIFLAFGFNDSLEPAWMMLKGVPEYLGNAARHPYDAFFEAINLLRQGGSLHLAFFLPAFFTSIWIWLFAISGFLLKLARRFDLGFDWFNRHLDIEKKPLQSIGLVAGSLVAVAYWMFELGNRFLF